LRFSATLLSVFDRLQTLMLILYDIPKDTKIQQLLVHKKIFSAEELSAITQSWPHVQPEPEEAGSGSTLGPSHEVSTPEVMPPVPQPPSTRPLSQVFLPLMLPPLLSSSFNFFMRSSENTACCPFGHFCRMSGSACTSGYFLLLVRSEEPVCRHSPFPYSSLFPL
jgi:hypothetical protein